MQLCYLDESGTPELPGTTSHYVLAGLAVPVWQWKTCDKEVAKIRVKYGVEGSELHTAWILRSYIEQRKIANFDAMTYVQRRQAVEQWRRGELLRLQKLPANRPYRQARKTFRNTDAYVHLTSDERKTLVLELAECVANWGFARLFAECVDKINFVSTTAAPTPDEDALEQVVSRFEHYLGAISSSVQYPMHGLLIHDNNVTVAKKHTQMMKKFHAAGTLWTDITHIAETPLFVNSELTSMVQIADLCSYALRRYLENKETALFDLVFQRADRRDNRVVGVRHFTAPGCKCKICSSRQVKKSGFFGLIKPTTE
jgi:hypothetical protein